MTTAAPTKEGGDPKILAFTTISISDPGVDLAGSAHMHYPPSVIPIMVPCSSGIRPSWVLHALESGFAGVFIAADGTDCAFVPDCTVRTSDVVAKAQKLIEEHGYNPRRLKMAAICSVCSESFVSHVEKFTEFLKEVKDS